MFKYLFFPHRIHTLPEAFVLVAHKLSFLSKSAERLLLKDAGIAVKIIKYCWLKNHIARIDGRAVLCGFLAERADSTLDADVEDAFGLVEVDGGECRDLSVAAVECDEFPDVDVTDTVSVGHEEGLVADVFLYAADASAGHGAEAGIDDGHAPWLGMLFVQDDLLPVAIVECHITRIEEIVVEPFLDHLLFVAGTYDEIPHAIVRVFFHDVPEDGPAADLDHGFGLILRFFTDTRAETACQDDCFHFISPLTFLMRNFVPFFNQF